MTRHFSSFPRKRESTTTIVGNWKMNATVDQARGMASEIRSGLEGIPDVEVAVCPPFTSLHAVRTVLEGSGIGVGAQDLHHEASGAFTGEVSVEMVAELCDYVIIGHSERRAHFGETNEGVRLKVAAALGAGLKAIVCVGERLDEREAGDAEAVVERQLTEGLAGVPSPEGLLVAYEPVWAIGTGRAATAADAQAMMAHVRSLLTRQFGAAAESVPLLYGGSVTDENVAELVQEPDVDGALVGGASLKPEVFVRLAHNAAACTSS